MNESEITLNEEDYRKELLNIIRELPAGNIYFMANPETVKKGFELYARHAVSGIRWDQERLIIKVLNSVVTLSIKRGNLHTKCNSHPKDSCEHILCCLFTLKNLLNPELFKIKWDKQRRSTLLSSLKGRASTDFYYLDMGEIFLNEEEETIPQLIFYPERVYKKIEIKIPDRSSNYYSTYKKRDYIKKNLYNSEFYKKEELLILLKYKGQEIPLSFDQGLQCQAFIGVYYNKHSCVIKKTAIGKDNSELIVIDRFVIDPSDARFTIVNENKWEALSAIRSSFYLYKDEDIFNDIAIESDTIYYIYGDRDYLNEFRFFSKKGETIPEKVLPNYLIEAQTKIDFYKEGKVIELKPLIETPLGSFTIYPPLYDLFVTIVNGGIEIFQKHEKRVKVLELLFDIILKELTIKDFEIPFKEIMNDLPQKKQKNLTRGLSYLTERLRNILKPFKSRLLFKNGEFYIIPIEIKKEVELLKTLYKTFEGLLFKYGVKDYSFKVPEDDFLKRLPELIEEAKDKGIRLLIGKKELRLSRWDINLSVIKDKDIDWFELHPEIRVNGVPISEKLWQQILEGRDPYIIGKDSIEVMDKETEEVINHLRRIVNLNKGSEKKRDIVRIPRLQILEWIELRKKGIRLAIPEDEERIVNKLLRFERIEEKPLPPSLKATLRPYQREGYNWLCFLYEHRLGGCLADDMGLGKTLQAISLLTAIKDGILTNSSLHPVTNSPHLIVVPPSLIFNWQQEIKRFAPQMSVYIYSGAERKEGFDGYDVVITSYPILRRDIKIFEERRFHVIVLDEAQAIKNIHAETTSSIRKLKGRFKLTLTGTPIENHLSEYYSIIDFSLPGLLGEYKDFKHYIKTYNEENLNTIIKRTYPFVLRRRKEEILKELPPKIETELFLELTPVQKGIYERTVKEVRAEVDEAYRTMRPERAKIVALTALLKLRQICLCPRLLSNELPEEAPKIDTLIEQLREVIDEGHSALVFSQFTSFLDIVEKRLKEMDFPLIRLDGSTPVHKRKEIVKTFQKSTSPAVFLLSLKAGGQGLNLTRASYVFHLDPWWNPAVEAQATDRTHRIGQVKKVTVMRFLMRHTIEEKMKILKARKQALYNAILNAKTSARAVQLTREDLDFLLGASEK